MNRSEAFTFANFMCSRRKNYIKFLVGEQPYSEGTNFINFYSFVSELWNLTEKLCIKQLTKDVCFGLNKYRHSPQSNIAAMQIMVSGFSNFFEEEIILLQKGYRIGMLLFANKSLNRNRAPLIRLFLFNSILIWKHLRLQEPQRHSPVHNAERINLC